MLSIQTNLSKTSLITLLIISIFFVHEVTIGQCNSQIGELQVLNFQHSNGIFICYNDTLKVKIESYELMDSHQLYYVYHDGIDVLNSTIIDADTLETEGLVNNNGIPFNIEIYATAAIASSSPLTDSCTVFSNTVKFIFLEAINTYSETDCTNGYQQEYDINLYITGGLPALDSINNYNISGDYNLNDLKTNEIKISDLSDHLINLDISDENGCHKSFLKFTNCEFLPIELIAFKGMIVDKGHRLNWITAVQNEVDYFTIEVSNNGIDFELLDTIDGAGTTLDIMEYEFTNENVVPGIYYYKLNQVGFDGTVANLGILQLIYFTQIVFPNPTNGNLSFQMQNTPSNLQIQILDLYGKQVLPIYKSQIERNKYGFSIDVSKLSDGIYFARIQTHELERTEKFVVEK